MTKPARIEAQSHVDQLSVGGEGRQATELLGILPGHATHDRDLQQIQEETV